MSNDIVEDIFTRVKEILGDEFGGQIRVKLDSIESGIRRDWGGGDAYIARKRDIEQRKADALDKLKQGLSVREASAQSGASVSCIYMMLRRKK